MLFKNYDFAITCATSSSAPQRGVLELSDSSLIWILAHISCVVAPSNRCQSRMPFGVQLLAKKYDVYQLLDAINYLINKKILQPDTPKYLLKI